MSQETSETELAAPQSGHEVAAGMDPATQIKLGARLGVWGIVGGFGVMTAFTLGAPISVDLAMNIMGVGVLASGVGTALASIGVLRRPGAVPRAIRAAAKVGMPLGGLLMVLGVTSLTRWDPLVAIVQALTPIAGTLGAVVMICLIAGFFFLRAPEDGE